MRCTLMNIAAFLAMTLFMASCFADDASAQADAQQAVENAVESEVYPVPENGTPEEYLKFIEKLLLILPICANRRLPQQTKSLNTKTLPLNRFSERSPLRLTA